MGLESPVRGAVHTCRGKCRKAKLRGACCDILGYLFQIREGLDIVDSVACLLQQCLIYNQSVGLDYICDAVYGVVFLQRVVIAGQLSVDIGSCQVIAVILPVCQTHRSVYLEQGRSAALAHLTHQSGLIVTGCCRYNGYRNAGLVGISLCQVLPLLILLRFEVQIVYRAFCSACFCGICLRVCRCRGVSSVGRSAAACQHGNCQSAAQCKS